ncbi:hypothetical protein GDO78_014219 [Eleutherodactylus coqui]|uniref:Uncharacterized protein n=1 Tax=Eleutherodactylus coqui TaxID=57060 RepID=A0A8J6EER6_ELECQ|nr:hypothetical protein GDO78_014219 [Eleutherodactylus coqui]
MNLLTSLILLGSLALTWTQTLGCSPQPGNTDIARNGSASQISDWRLESARDGAELRNDAYKGRSQNADAAERSRREKTHLLKRV